VNTRKKICQPIAKLYNQYDFLLDSEKLNDNEKDTCRKVSADMEDYIATDSLNAPSDYLMRYYDKKVILLLDEYDTPMQEAYANGYWEEPAAFTRNLFNSTFKTNPYLERAVMTGITRISKESIFSDLNNLEVVTTTSGKYAECFGFTQEEVINALEEYGLSGEKHHIMTDSHLKKEKTYIIPGPSLISSDTESLEPTGPIPARTLWQVSWCRRETGKLRRPLRHYKRAGPFVWK
jgi:hypothetical protein